MRTILPQEIEGTGATDTAVTQESAELDGRKVRFPKRIKHRGRVLATIYGKSRSYPLYRVSWTAGGRRLMQAFRTYSEAKRHADGKKTELAKGSKAAALSAGQALDALAAFERLQSFYQSTGRRISPLAAVSEFAEAARKLDVHTLGAGQVVGPAGLYSTEVMQEPVPGHKTRFDRLRLAGLPVGDILSA